MPMPTLPVSAMNNLLTLFVCKSKPLLLPSLLILVGPPCPARLTKLPEPTATSLEPNMFVAVTVPPTNTPAATPTPPNTRSAPVAVELAADKPLTNSVESTVPVPYILVPGFNFAIVYYLPLLWKPHS